MVVVKTAKSHEVNRFIILVLQASMKSEKKAAEEATKAAEEATKASTNAEARNTELVKKLADAEQKADQLQESVQRYVAQFNGEASQSCSS